MSGLPMLLREALKAVAEPSKAPKMQAYMKSSMPCLGVQATNLRGVCKHLFAEVELSNAKQWQALILELWRGARYREERYAAIELLRNKRALSFRTLKALPLYEELIVTGAWWDFVDTIAAHCVGELLASYPRQMKAKMLTWSRCKDMWKRRTAILSQLRFKEHTDIDLLYRCIEPSLSSNEFFLQKAIGWALRQYAWTNPNEIKRYARLHDATLSSLSKREALKNL
jgi:3-methyladenine DNA glycosylase AlkD